MMSSTVFVHTNGLASAGVGESGFVACVDEKPFRYYKTSPDVIRLAVMMYIRFPLSLRQVEDLLHERGIDISYETVRAWWNQFGPIVCGGNKKETLSVDAGFAAMAMASR